MHHDWYIIITIAVLGTYCIQRYVSHCNRRPH